MGRLETFAMILVVMTLVLIPVLILGDSIKSNTIDESIDQNSTSRETPPPGIKDVNMAQEMQYAIDTLEIKGVDTTELKNLKTEYAAYNNEEELALVEDDFENALKYRNEKEKVLISFTEILKDNGYYSMNIYQYLNQQDLLED